MSHFTISNGTEDERLYISISADGIIWNTLNNGNPVYQPANWSPFNNVVRDPSILYHNGFYWVTHTSGRYGFQPSFALLRSPDLLNWTFMRTISTVVPGQQVNLTWGPFFYKDPDGSVHVFVSLQSPTVLIRTYEVHALDENLTQWSAPVAVELPFKNAQTTEISTNEFWPWKEGDVYHALYIDFKDNQAYCHVTSNSLMTGWTNRVRLGFDSLEGGYVLKKPTGGYLLPMEGRHEGGNVFLGYRAYSFTSSFVWEPGVTVFTTSKTFRNGKVILAPQSTSFSEWAPSVGLPAGNPFLDTDLDGILDVAEFTLGLSPLIPDATVGKTWRDSLGRLRYSHTRLPSAKASLVLKSTDFISGWQDATDSMRLNSATMMVDGRELVEWIQNASAPSSLGIRLEATIPDP